MRWIRLSIYYLPLLHGALCLWMMNPRGLEPVSDEPVYVSLAKSLATTGSYNSIFLPGNPAHGKYPFLYPWLLSRVWRITPEFPANVTALRLFNIAIGMAFLGVLGAMLFASRVCTYQFAFCILLICSLHPAVIANSISLHSETAFSLFTCLGIWALFHGDIKSRGLTSSMKMRFWRRVALRRDPDGAGPSSIVTSRGGLKGSWGYLLIGGGFFGCAFYVRTAGLALAAGFLCYLLRKSRWREALVWSALTLTLIFPWFYWESTRRVSTDFPEYIFYGSYFTIFLKLIHTQGLLKFLTSNVLCLVVGIPKLLIFPFQTNLRFITHMTMWAGFPLLFVLARGVIRSCPEHFDLVRWYLLFSLLMLLLWPFPAGERFLSPLLPFFFLFLFFEGAHWVRKKKTASNRTPKLFLAIWLGYAALGGLCVTIHFVHFVTLSLHHNRTFESGEIEMRESFEWIKTQTLPSDVLMANFDPLYYLHTGRKTAPMSFEYARRIDEPRFDISPIRKHRIRYLIVGEHDFEVFTPDVVDLMRRELQNTLDGSSGIHFLKVFESSHRKYVIYQIGVENGPQVAGA